jgi:undecaprenyl-diphosphatase
MSVVQADGPRAGAEPTEPSRAVVGAVVLVAALVVFVAALGLLVHRGVGDWRFDRRVEHAFRHRDGPVVVDAARLLADLAAIQSLLFISVVIAFGLIALRVRAVLCAVPLVSLLVAGALVQIVKIAIPRSSPNTYFRTGDAGGVSFPSGHAADTTALAVGLAIVLAVTLARRPRERVVLFGAAALVSIAVGLSRLVLGVHWPTDVLAGWALGLGTAVVIGTLGVLAADGTLVPTLRGLFARRDAR